MKSIWPEKIRELLRKENDGLTVNYIAEELGAKPNSIDTALNRKTSMPDAYIDRWTEGGQQRPPQAIWCVVVPPPNMPRPTRKKK